MSSDENGDRLVSFIKAGLGGPGASAFVHLKRSDGESKHVHERAAEFRDGVDERVR